MAMEITDAVMPLIWRASWQAGLLVLVVLLVQYLLGKRLAPRWRYALWLLVVGRLLLPVSLESGLSIFNFAGVDRLGEVRVGKKFESAPATSSKKADDPVMVRVASSTIAMTGNESATGVNEGQVEEASFHYVPSNKPVAPAASPVAIEARSFSVSWAMAAFWIWLTGALFIGARLAWGNLRFAMKLRDLQPVKDPALLDLFAECAAQVGVGKRVELVATADVETPALFGCFRPRLLLPERFSQQFSTREMRYIFLHELAHIRRGDVFVNWLMAVLQALHWFNPFVWIGFHRMRADRELACDALALSFAREEESRSYGETIIKLLENFTRGTAVPGLVGILEDKQQMKERLTFIANFKKSSRWQALAILLVAGLGMVTLTDAQTRGIRGEPSEVLAGSNADRQAENAASYSTIDLRPFYDLLAEEASQFGMWEVVPKGLQNLNGVPFRMDGMVRLYGQIPPPHGTIYRERVEGIPVGKTFGALHLLHGTGWTTDDGAEIARVILNYADGQRVELPVVYGVHVRDWWRRETDSPNTVADAGSRLAWEGSRDGIGLRFYQSELRNPKPEVVVETIDLVSSKSPVTPAIVSMTIGSASQQTGKIRVIVPSDNTRKVTTRILVVDGSTQRPVVKAGLQVTFCDETGCRYLGAFQTDENGEKALAFPTTQLTAMSVAVVAEGYSPKSISWAGFNGEEFRETFKVELTKGRRVGGVIKDESGKPVAGVKVDPYTSFMSEETRRAETVNILRGSKATFTDASGRWFIEGMPSHLNNVVFELDHSSYLPGTVSTEGYQYRVVGWDRVAASALFEERAEFVLRKGKTITGRILDEKGNPVSAAQVNLSDSLYNGNRRSVSTSADGEFLLQVSPKDSRKLFVLKEGYAPFVTNFVEYPQTKIELRLGKGQVLRGRVVDGTGKPLQGASLSAESWAGHRILNWRGSTDAEGRFKWDSAPPDKVDVSVFKSGFQVVRNYQMTPGRDEMIIMRPAIKASGTVFDLQTGMPLKTFNVYLNEDYGSGSVYVRKQSRVQNEEGKFEMEIEETTSGRHLLRVEAEGYLPEKSSPFRQIPDAPFEFAMKKSSWLEGVVWFNGKPVSEAQLVLLTPQSRVKLGGGRINSSAGTIRITDEEGRFKITPDPDATALIVVHKSGYAEINASEFNTLSRIDLQAWGRIEGTLKVGSQIAKDGKVLLSPTHGLHTLSYDVTLSDTRTDEKGEFAFEKVPPGDSTLFRAVPRGDSGHIGSHATYLTIKPGETTRVQFGGTGRPVTGKLLASEPERKVNWQFSHVSLSTRRPRPPEGVESDEELAAWMKSEAVREAIKRGKRFNAAISEDGSFKIDDVPSGNYEFTGQVFEPREDSAMGKLIGHFSRELSVPEMEGGRSDEALDVGEVTVTLRRELPVGSVVPEFSVKTLEDKPLKLSDLRGKYVLLDFWAVWCGPCVAEMPHLKQVYEEFGRNERFQMVGLSLDPKAETTRKFVEQNEIKWTQGFLGEWSKTELPNQYGVSGIPALFLINPEGKIVAKGMRGDAIRAAVAQALLK